MSLRCAVIGLGVGEQHAQTFRDAPDCDLVAICDTDAGKLADVAGRFPGVATVADAAAVIADPAVDLVSICSYDDAHAEQVIAALAAGKHVFVEKPLCTQSAEARAIRAALAANPACRLSSNLILRRSPRFVDLRRRTQAGELGEIYHMNAAYNYGRLHKLTEGWRGQQPDYSVTLGGGVHLIDLLIWITGELPVSVTAAGNAICSRGTASRVPDLETATLTWASGRTAVVTSNFGCVYPHYHQLEIYGTDATFVNGRDTAQLYTSRDPDVAPEALTTAYPGTHKGDLLRQFIAALSGRDAEAITADDVFACLSICFAIREAARSSHPVTIDYL